jgi:hypothetical protein
MSENLRIKGLVRMKPLMPHGIDIWRVRPECQGCHDRVPIRHMWRWQKTGMQRCSACLLLWYVEELEKAANEEEHT